jgi:integrase
MKLTRQSIAKLSLPAGKSEAIKFDDEVAGFGLRVRAGGSRTWIVQYKVGEKHRRLTLGSTALLDPVSAREKAKDILAAVRVGRDPAGEKAEARAEAAETILALISRFLGRQRARLRPRSYEETERYLLKHWKNLHGLSLGRIDRRTVSARLAAIADEKGPVAADRAKAALSAFFSWAMREGLSESNPTIGTNRYHEAEPRDRVLTADELRAIWKALPDGDFGRIIKLLILTGQRRDEIANLRWSEVDLDRGLLSLPAERTKNGVPHDVPLSRAARAVVESIPRRYGRELVFGEGQRGFQGWSNCKERLDKAAPIAPWRLHDLRRTAATGMGELGVLPHVVEATLNHISGHRRGVAGTYNRAVYAAEKARALDLWADQVLAVVGGRESNVIAVPASA